MSPGDLGGGAELQDAAGPLLVLTAVELEVLEAAHLQGLAEHTPAGGGSSAPAGPDVDAAWDQAIRSLAARGLLGPDGRIEERTTSGLLARTVLDVRLGSAALVVVERLLGGPDERRDLRQLHLVPPGAVVEDVHAEGLHGFDLVLDPVDLGRAVTQMVVPPDAAAGSGGPRALDPARPELLANGLGAPTVLAELSLVTPTSTGGAPADAYLLALGPGGCFAARRPRPDVPGPGTDAPVPGRAPGPPAALTFLPVTPGWVEELARAWVGTVVEPTAEAGTMTG